MADLCLRANQTSIYRGITSCGTFGPRIKQILNSDYRHRRRIGSVDQIYKRRGTSSTGPQSFHSGSLQARGSIILEASRSQPHSPEPSKTLHHPLPQETPAFKNPPFLVLPFPIPHRPPHHQPAPQESTTERERERDPWLPPSHRRGRRWRASSGNSSPSRPPPGRPWPTTRSARPPSPSPAARTTPTARRSAATTTARSPATTAAASARSPPPTTAAAPATSASPASSLQACSTRSARRQAWDAFWP